MSAVTVALLMALAGGVGAVLRYLISWGLHAARTRSGGQGEQTWPWATVVVNVLGTLACVGAWRAANMDRIIGQQLAGILMTGFAGGFTTVSTAALELAELWRERRRATAAWALAATMIPSIVGILYVLMAVPQQ